MRQDIGWLLPIMVLAIYQVKFVWGGLARLKQDEIEIPGEYSSTRKLLFFYMQQSGYLLFVIQLSFPVLIFHLDAAGLLISRITGYALVLGGFAIALKAVKDLGSNWMGMYEYGIKKGQRLVTGGIYKYVRHPIYLAIILEITGFELAAVSWLALILPACALVVIINHIKKEDRLLEIKYGAKYLKYYESTGALFPRIVLN